MTVFENLAFSLKIRKYPKAEIERRVQQAAETLGLTNFLQRKPRALSGGQRQRVALGRAIVRRPKLFLFDEPLSNLDARLRVSMRAELIKLHHLLDATIIYVTHDQIEAMSMGDRLIVLNEGVVQQIGPPLEIYNRPANQFVASFIGSPSINFIDCILAERDGAFFLINSDLQLKLPASRTASLRNALGERRELILGIRPEDIYERQTYGRPIDGNTGRARVEFLEPLGNEVLATCVLGGRELVVRLSPRTEARNDQSLELVFDLEQAKLFEPSTGAAIS
jgi:multiple sugar transport system ATP-binding protein